MLPIVTDGVALSVILSVCHTSEPCKNGCSDRDWVEDSGEPKESYIRWGPYPHERGNCWWICATCSSANTEFLHCRLQATEDNTACKCFWWAAVLSVFVTDDSNVELNGLHSCWPQVVQKLFFMLLRLFGDGSGKKHITSRKTGNS